MQKKAKNFLRLKQLARQDQFYRDITAEFRRLDPRFLAVVSELSDRQRQVIEDYLWSIDLAGRYMTLLVCEKMEFVEKEE